MPTNDEKVSKFMQAINSYAQDQRDQMMHEVDEYIGKELEKAESEVLYDAYRLIQKETAQMGFDIRRELSRKEMNAKKELLSHRTELVSKVFDDARNKLIDYANSKEYVDFIKNSAKKMSETLNSDDVVVSVNERDIKLSKEILKVFAKGCTVNTSDEIEIGGLLGYSEKLGLVVDETLDTRLDSQHEWFYENSKFNIVRN